MVRRVVIAGSVSLVLVVTTVVLMGVFDSVFSRMLAFVFLQYPAMLIGYVTGNEVSVYMLGVVSWILWSVVIFAALWVFGTFAKGLRDVDRSPKHA